jgi:hypothetical protein
VSQTQRGSVAEAATNIVVGFALNFALNLIIFPALGVKLPTAVAFHAGLLFTGISLIRSYVLRRIFNSMRRFNVAE